MLCPHRLRILFFQIFALVLLSLSNADQICGKVGWHDLSTPFLMGNFFYRAPSIFPLCADFCKKDFPRCKSFRYSYYADADAQFCEFFGTWLDQVFTPDDTQPYYYYDADCPFPTYTDPATETQFITTTVYQMASNRPVNTSAPISLTSCTQNPPEVQTQAISFVVTLTTTTTATVSTTWLATSTRTVVSTVISRPPPSTTSIEVLKTTTWTSISRTTITSTSIRISTVTATKTKTETRVPMMGENAAPSTTSVTIYHTSTVTYTRPASTVRIAITSRSTATSRVLVTVVRTTTRTVRG